MQLIGANRQMNIGVDNFRFSRGRLCYGTLSLASSDRALSLPRTSMAETE
jgi:hypothetical protein